jgi:hypothetical protein
MKNNIPENMTEYRKIMLEQHMSAIKGNVRPADLMAQANVYGKTIAGCKVQLEHRKMVGDDEPIEFLEGK